MGCAWLYIYPYVSGELNFQITTLAHGMRAKQVFPDGLALISIPYDLLPLIIGNLEKMEWYLPAYTEGREAHNRKFQEEIVYLNKKLSDQQSG